MKNLVFLLLFLLTATAFSDSKKSLFVYCAAGMRKPVEQIAKNYEAATGTKVELTFDGSNKLLGQIKLVRKGDVYIAGDADYITMARKDNLAGNAKTICYFIPVILVKKGNPLKIATLSDLLKPKTKIGQADDKAAAVGRLMPKLLAANGIDTAAWRKNIVVSTATVNELGIAVKLGTIDGTIVWNSIAAGYTDACDIVQIPLQKNVIAEVEGAVLSFTKDQSESQRFLDYLASDKAKDVLKASSYVTERPSK